MKTLVTLFGVTLLLAACSDLEEKSAETLESIRSEYKDFGLLDGVTGNTLPHSTVDANGNPISTEAREPFVYTIFVDEPTKDILDEHEYRALWKEPTTNSIYPTYDLHVYIRRHDEDETKKEEIYPFYGVAPVVSGNGEELPMLLITLTTESGQALTTIYPEDEYDISIVKRPNFGIEHYTVIELFEKDIYARSESISGVNPIPSGYRYALVQTTTSIGEFTYQKPVAVTSSSFERLKQNTPNSLEVVETNGPSFYSQFYSQ